MRAAPLVRGRQRSYCADTMTASSADANPRLAVVTEQLLAPVPGGTGRFTRELAAALVATAPSASVSGWCAWHSSTRAAQIDGLDGPHRLVLGRRALSVVWERGIGPVPRKADVVLAPTLLVPPRKGRPLVVTVPDTVPWSHPETLTPRGVAFHRRMARRAAAEADAILVYTHAVRAEVIELFGIESDRIHVVGAGASAIVTTAPRDAIQRRLTLGLPAAYALTVSTLEPRKGLDVVLDALAVGPTLPLVVVGQPGWGGVDLAAAMRERGLGSDRVLALGKIADLDLAAVLAGATVLVAPSRAEGFGLPVLEAMAAGVPVVCSDIPAFAEVGAGVPLVFPVGDAAALASAMQRLRDDAGLGASAAERGRERARSYSWDRTAAKVWAVVSAVAG